MNDRQRRFADLVIQGRPAGRAYEEAGYLPRGEVADSCATKLLRNAQVKAHIKRLREKSSSEAVWSAQEIKEGLTRMAKVAESEKDHSGFSGLVDRLCKMEGHYEKETVEHTGTVRVVIGGEDE